MLKFIKKLLQKKKKEITVEDLSCHGPDYQIKFLHNLLELVEKSNVHPINLFLVLLQYLTILSGDISLKEDQFDLNDTQLLLDSIIKETHQFLAQQVNKINKSVVTPPFHTNSSNSIH